MKEKYVKWVHIDKIKKSRDMTYHQGEKYKEQMKRVIEAQAVIDQEHLEYQARAQIKEKNRKRTESEEKEEKRRSLLHIRNKL
jgi:hypothetical protein